MHVGQRARFQQNRDATLSSICFLQGNATEEIRAIQVEALGEHGPSYATVKTGFPSLNMMILQPVTRLVQYDPKQWPSRR
jgi:hypothetical protein